MMLSKIHLQKILFFLMLAAISMLASCKAKITYSYLIQHPHFLKQHLVKCHDQNPDINQQTGDCKVIVQTAAVFFHALSEEESDPEKFGQQVLDTQMQYAAALVKWHQATQALLELKNKKVPQTELQNAQDQVTKAKNLSQQLDDMVQIDLAVISLNSPE